MHEEGDFLAARGIMVAVVGYDLCPNVGIGDIVEQMRANQNRT